MNADLINAAFEGGGACLLTMNVRRLYLDKKLSGVALAPTVWFNVWGAWNLFYYFHLGQLASWVAGMLVFIVNTTWVAMALVYRTRNISRKQAAENMARLWTRWSLFFFALHEPTPDGPRAMAEERFDQVVYYHKRMLE